jgi:hypothetical protein
MALITTATKKQSPRTARTRRRPRQMTDHPRSRAAGQRNPHLGDALTCENPAVRTPACAFSTADVHSRRALLGWAARFAGAGEDYARWLSALDGPVTRATCVDVPAPMPRDWRLQAGSGK